MADEGSALCFAADDFRGGREVVMTAVANWGHALSYATEELRGDREVVMAAVAKNGCALCHATEELRGDREVVMTAVAQDGLALQYATEEVREDKEIMDAALARASATIGYRPIGLKARLNPTCLPCLFACVIRGRFKVQAASGTLLRLCVLCFSLSGQILKPSFLSVVVRGSVLAGSLR